MTKQVPTFTAEQVTGLLAARRVADLLVAETQDHVPQPDSVNDDPASDVVLAKKYGLGIRNLILPGEHWYSLSGRFGRPDTAPFAMRYPKMLTRPAYSRYGDLNTHTIGSVATGTRGNETFEQYDVFCIAEPHNVVLDGLSIVVGAQMRFRPIIEAVDGYHILTAPETYQLEKGIVHATTFGYAG